MEPFRDLFKKDKEFAWDQDLQLAFESARMEIAKLVEQGVKCFRFGE